MLSIAEHFGKPLIHFSLSDTQIFKSIIHRLEFLFKQFEGKLNQSILLQIITGYWKGKLL